MYQRPPLKITQLRPRWSTQDTKSFFKKREHFFHLPFLLLCPATWNGYTYCINVSHNHIFPYIALTLNYLLTQFIWKTPPQQGLKTNSTFDSKQLNNCPVSSKQIPQEISSPVLPAVAIAPILAPFWSLNASFLFTLPAAPPGDGFDESLFSTLSIEADLVSLRKGLACQARCSLQYEGKVSLEQCKKYDHQI